MDPVKAITIRIGINSPDDEALTEIKEIATPMTEVTIAIHVPAFIFIMADQSGL